MGSLEEKAKSKGTIGQVVDWAKEMYASATKPIGMDNRGERMGNVHAQAQMGEREPAAETRKKKKEKLGPQEGSTTVYWP